MYSSYNKFFKKHYGRVYSLATRFLYAVQYTIRLIFRSFVYIFRGGEDRKRQAIEAAWHIRYSLFPQENRV